MPDTDLEAQTPQTKTDESTGVPGAGQKGHERSTIAGIDWRVVKQGYRRFPPTGYTKLW